MPKNRDAKDYKELVEKYTNGSSSKVSNLTLGKNSTSSPDPEPIPLTIGMSMNEALKVAQSLPRMKRLFSTLLLENTLNIWGGDNGVGKSIFAFALADHLARGWKFEGFENECDPLKILLYDFELTLQGLYKRYSDANQQNPYQFSPNLYRYDFNPDYSDFSKNYDDLLFDDIRMNVKKLGAKLLIIDNLSALKSKSNSDGDIALDLMNRLNRLKKELNITIIVLTHITKHPSGLPIEKNHIAGSKHIQNLCDGIVAIGASCQGENKIYIKELKNRYEQEQYREDNIIVCERIKKDNFLTIAFLEFDVESNHLVRQTERTNDEEPKIKAIKLKEAGKSIGFIAMELKKSKSTIHEWIKSVRSFENPKQTERTNDPDQSDSASTNSVRSANERPNDSSYEQIKELAKQVLGEYPSREKRKVIQAIKVNKDVDDDEAEVFFDSMLEYEFISQTDNNQYSLVE